MARKSRKKPVITQVDISIEGIPTGGEGTRNGAAETAVGKHERQIKSGEAPGQAEPEQTAPEQITPGQPITEDTRTPTAAYIRLSTENGNRGDEGTFQTQINLVHDYINENPDLVLYDTYTDNGFTGTNFNRPGFTRMMDDVRRGRVRCIVVKDLSRFGRDYLEAGSYIETIFPRLGVRLIAITDNFDSARPGDIEGLELPIKNLINTMYAKDISKKIRSRFDMLDEQGLWFGVRPPYGYFKVTEDGRHTLVPDPDTAVYVRAIYHWFLSGVGMHEIARRLELAGAVTPAERNPYGDERKRKVNQTVTNWSAVRVKAILTNPLYTGDTVNRRTKAVPGRSHVSTDPEEWNIIPDTHEALIRREDFETVQEMLKGLSRKREALVKTGEESRERKPAIFKGKIFCGACGRVLYTEYKSRGDGSRYNIYKCGPGSNGRICGKEFVNEDVLKILILDQIRLLLTLTCDRRALVKELIRDNPTKGRLGRIRGRIVIEETKIAELERKETRGYEDFTLGLLEKEDYVLLKESLKKSRKASAVKIRELEKEESALRETAERFLKLTDNFDEYLKLDGYRADLVEQLVERIEYFPDGSIGLTMKCADVYKQMEELILSYADDSASDEHK